MFLLPPLNLVCCFFNVFCLFLMKEPNQKTYSQSKDVYLLSMSFLCIYHVELFQSTDMPIEGNYFLFTACLFYMSSIYSLAECLCFTTVATYIQVRCLSYFLLIFKVMVPCAQQYTQLKRFCVVSCL